MNLDALVFEHWKAAVNLYAREVGNPTHGNGDPVNLDALVFEHWKAAVNLYRARYWPAHLGNQWWRGTAWWLA